MIILVVPGRINCLVPKLRRFAKRPEHDVRKNRYVILTKDLEKGYKSNVKKNTDEFEFYK